MMSVPPLDTVLKSRGIGNQDLVRASTRQLTFKQVQKARLGRRVTPNIQGKIVDALNACGDITYDVRELFDYL
ncbi:MAG: hypothetical protein WCI27_04130 [Candidatus Omnitrophota bacterium]